ncbi:uncharacterized protein LOC132547420 [Ylistrum balloti]|uniref:uncharacterized protein LOC132547420 n=1 Tax=Ylistrum balloti TaxID=509963 RepID=UPI002905E792|nr:uncharacterized protein LOC132547420 [Ylistrum balloti]
MTPAGTEKFGVSLGGTRRSHNLVVADIRPEAILGLGFLRRHKCAIDVSQSNLKIGEMTRKCHTVGSLGVCRVSLDRTITIPETSEVVVSVPVIGCSEDASYLIEPAATFKEKHSLLAGRTFVKLDESSCVPVRVLNPDLEPKTIGTGTHVGWIEQAQEPEPIKPVTSGLGQKGVLPAHLSSLLKDCSQNLTADQNDRAKSFLRSYAGLFARDDSDLGQCQAHQTRARRVALHARDEFDKELNSMLERKVIEPSTSPWGAGVVLVRKRDGKLRFCVDYRGLNAVTLQDAYPLPRVDDSLDALSGATWFSTADLMPGYWLVEVHPDHKPKTAFATKRGLFQFNVLPFGLCNAPITFERMTESVLAGL